MADKNKLQTQNELEQYAKDRFTEDGRKFVFINPFSERDYNIYLLGFARGATAIVNQEREGLISLEKKLEATPVK